MVSRTKTEPCGISHVSSLSTVKQRVEEQNVAALHPCRAEDFSVALGSDTYLPPPVSILIFFITTIAIKQRSS